MVRLTDRPNMTLDFYCGRKTTTQQYWSNYARMNWLVNLLLDSTASQIICVHVFAYPKDNMRLLRMNIACYIVKQKYSTTLVARTPLEP